MLNPSLATIAITIINLIFLFFVLKAILFKPVTRFIEARQAKIKLDIDNAVKDREEAGMMRSSYEEKLKKAHEDAQVVIQNAKRTADNNSAAIIAEAKKQAEGLLQAARAQIAAERQAAYLLFKKEAASLVLAAVSRILKRQVAGEDARNLAEQALNECMLGSIKGRQN